ncbi:hypothetical protein Taro_005312, partial [Colocasia esculenta]|nr:hypothetical protein [Colocasia esculenta]
MVNGNRRPSIGLVYAKLEPTKKKIHEVSPRYAHLVLDVVEERWDRQMSRDLHMATYYLHPAYHYAHELAYDDDLTVAFTRVVEKLSRSPIDAADAIDHASICHSRMDLLVMMEMVEAAVVTVVRQVEMMVAVVRQMEVMAQLSVFGPGTYYWDHSVKDFQNRYSTFITWDEFHSHVSAIK